MRKRPRIGLALGGGGARGLAHIGVLKVLEREGIPIDLIVGTSMGALVGAAYAVNPDATALEGRAVDMISRERRQRGGLPLLKRVYQDNGSKSDVFHWLSRIAHKEIFLNLAVFRKALLSETEIRRYVKALLPDIDVGETTIPYAATAVDLVSGREIVLRQGPLIRAVMASCAVPGFMPPITWDGMVLVDGGVADTVPARPVKQAGADIVIGVDVVFCLCLPPRIEDGIDVISRAMEIMSFCLNRRSRKSADIIIEPAVKHIVWTDFPKYEEIIREGEKAAEEKLREIRAMVNHRFRRRLYREVIKLVPGVKRESHKGDVPGHAIDWPVAEQIRPGKDTGDVAPLQNQPVSPETGLTEKGGDQYVAGMD